MVPKNTNSLEELGIGNHVWIYAWDEVSGHFYGLIPESACTTPVRVRFDASSYDHLVVVTRDVPRLKWAMTVLRDCGFLDNFHIGGEGFLVTREMSLTDLDNERYRGTPAFLYAKKCIRRLYTLLQYNYHPFGIEALGVYRHTFQCYFDSERRRNKNFQSRGLFQITGPDTLAFVSGDVWRYCPPYKMLIFDLKTCRVNYGVGAPDGDSLQDRVVMATFREVTPTETKTWSVGYWPGKNESIATTTFHSTEHETVAHILDILSNINAMFIVGYNTDEYAYHFLFKRAALYGLLSTTTANLSRCCRMVNSSSVARVLIPPWILSIDVALFCKRFFPRDKYVNPPSDTLEACAESLFGQQTSRVKCPPKLGKTYCRLENHDQENALPFFQQVIRHCEDVVSLITDMVRVLDVIPITFSLGQLADADPEMCLRSNSNTVIARTFFENHFQATVMAPLDYQTGKRHLGDRGHGYFARKYARLDEVTPLRGGLVLDPQIGVHSSDETRVLRYWDFRSLYPSIMHGLNIQTGFVTRVFEDVEVDDDKYHVLQKGKYLYVSVKTLRAPIGTMCEMLIEQRIHHVNSGHDTLALSLKLLINSIYGLTACQGNWCDEIVPVMITGYGRHFLRRVEDYAVRCKFDVLAGDTDSVFLSMSRDTSPDDFSCGFMEEFRQSFKEATLVRLDIKGTFRKLIICCKKKYVGLLDDGSLRLVGLPKRMRIDHYWSLRAILKEVLSCVVTHPTDYKKYVRQLIPPWFETQVRSDDDAHFQNTMRIKPLYKYKDQSCIPYLLGHDYERHRGSAITATGGVVVPYYILVPLVPGKVKQSVCFVEAFDATVQTIDKTQSVVTNFSPSLDNVLKAVDPEEGESYGLKRLAGKYLYEERLRLYQRHEVAGYAVYDLSSLPLPALTLLNPSTVLNDDFNLWFKLTNRIKEEGHLILKVILHHNQSSDTWLTIPAFRPDTTKKFHTLQEIADFFPQVIRPWIHLAFDDASSQVVDVTDFSQMTSFFSLLYSVKNTNNDNPPQWLIVLPHVAIKKKIGDANVQFTYV